MEKKTGRSYSLSELAEWAGLPARTIRFYISRGLLPGPHQAGRGASYGAEHLQVLERIQQLQEEGRTLVEISRALNASRENLRFPAPAAWWNYQLAEDVVVMVRAENSPWRLRRIQKALAELAQRLGDDQEEELRDESK